MDKLPTKLGKEPLIDVVFEVRFSSDFEASDVLPGYLFSKLEGEKKTERLPVSDIPKKVRDSDPNLRFSPVVRLRWNRFLVSIGDHVLTVACQMPYPGWNDFRSAIHHVLAVVKDIGVINDVVRYSLKYIDLLESSSLGEQISKINFSVELAGHKLAEEYFNLRVDIPEGDFLHLVTVSPEAQVSFVDGQEKKGVIVDVDSLRICQDQSVDDWFLGLEEALDELHVANKKMFFKLIKDKALEELEPVYA